jgi:hypothetical protein
MHTHKNKKNNMIDYFLPGNNNLHIFATKHLVFLELNLCNFFLKKGKKKDLDLDLDLHLSGCKHYKKEIFIFKFNIEHEKKPK